MASDTREYDAFGPWIDEVAGPDDVPRLFREHPLDATSARLVLKVPRPIARRDATADMDLYDHLLVLQERRFTVLSRHQDGRPGYTTRTVDLEDVVAVFDEVDLLDGRLHVHTRDGQVLSVGYNGSARDRVRRLIDGLRVPSQDQGTVPTSGPELTRDALGPDDVAVVADVYEVLRTCPGLLPLAWHGRQVLRPRASGPAGVLRMLTHLLSPMTVQAAVVARDADHLEVFSRRGSLIRGRRPVHSASRLVVPLHALDQIQVQPHPHYAGVTNLVLRAGKARLHITVLRGSDAEHVLRDVRTESR